MADPAEAFDLFDKSLPDSNEFPISTRNALLRGDQGEPRLIEIEPSTFFKQYRRCERTIRMRFLHSCPPCRRYSLPPCAFYRRQPKLHFGSPNSVNGCVAAIPTAV